MKFIKYPFAILLLFLLVACTSSVPTPKDNGEYAKALRTGDLAKVKDFYGKFNVFALSNFGLLGNSYNPIEIAANSDQPDIVEYLLRSGADPNAISPTYKSPIIFSIIENKKIRSVIMLLNHGLKTEINDDSGRNLLRFAAGTGDYEIVKTLLPFIKNINMVDGNNGNALYGAISSRNVDIFNEFIKRGIDINHKDNHMNTPLMFAIGSNNPSMAEKLIELGADISVVNEKGFTAAKIAAKVQLHVRGLLLEK